ncbi:hypothetical protein ACS2TZ_08175 [Bacillus cereus group sp. Bce025]|nr:hypothetical protein [Bacillus cereus]MDA2494233.1 hypothetical protein [Bacillus cereus]HDR4455234.1 hypothetical protein [Bacillus cereus]
MERKEFVDQIGANANVGNIVNVNKTFKDKQFSYFTFDQMRLVEEGLISSSTFTVFCWMISRPQKWSFVKSYMYKLFKRDTVDKAFRELISVGHLVVINCRVGKKEELCVRVFAERQTPLKMKQYATRMIQKLKSEGKNNISISDPQWGFFSSQPLELDNTECTDWEVATNEEEASEVIVEPSLVADTSQLTVFDLIEGITVEEDTNSVYDIVADEPEINSLQGYANRGNKIIYSDRDGRPTNKAILPSQIIPDIVYHSIDFIRKGVQAVDFAEVDKAMEEYFEQTKEDVAV